MINQENSLQETLPNRLFQTVKLICAFPHNDKSHLGESLSLDDSKVSFVTIGFVKKKHFLFCQTACQIL